MVEIRFNPGVPAPSINDFNSMKHWAQRRRALEPWRDAIGWAWKALPRAQRLLVENKPCTVTFTIPFQKNRIRDPHNYVDTVVKACIDQLVKQQVWPDDNPEWISVNEPKLVIDTECIVTLEPR